MTPFDDAKKFAQIVYKIDPHSTLLHAWTLTGGLSAQVTALEIEQADGEMKSWWCAGMVRWISNTIHR